MPQYTDYSLVNRWWHFGHEIASHSITHRNNLNYWKVKIVIDEVNGDDDEGGVEIWHSPTLLQLKRVVICHSHYLNLSNHDDVDCKRECKS